MALLNLTAFQDISTEDLIAMAQAMPGGTKVQIPDRLTAIVLILGTRPLDTELGQNLPADYIRRVNAPLSVAGGDVLCDRASVLVHRVRPNHGAIPRDRDVHFSGRSRRRCCGSAFSSPLSGVYGTPSRR